MMTQQRRAGPHVIRIVIVDDHAMVAEGFRRVLEAEPDLAVVEVAPNAERGVAAVAQHRPDVVLMDYALPDGDGVAATRAIGEASPGTAVLMLTGAGSVAVQAAFAAGASGYIEKTGPMESLAPAVRSAAAGRVVLSRRNLDRLVAPPPQPEAEPDGPALTGRERDVLLLVADGKTNRAAAEALDLSVNTVRTHVQSLLAKLEAHSKLEAVAIARRRGLV
jgi:DNA-binding NarL/FixJ family response regulator